MITSDRMNNFSHRYAELFAVSGASFGIFNWLTHTLAPSLSLILLIITLYVSLPKFIRKIRRDFKGGFTCKKFFSELPEPEDDDKY